MKILLMNSICEQFQHFVISLEASLLGTTGLQTDFGPANKSHIPLFTMQGTGSPGWYFQASIGKISLGMTSAPTVKRAQHLRHSALDDK